MNISTTNEKRVTYNTIGILRGSVEDGKRWHLLTNFIFYIYYWLFIHNDLYKINVTDRYVLLGNHHDAWSLGALDPSSGTASIVEIARAFGKIKKDRRIDLFKNV